jgi:ADP-heptose:LPS heptosyltransferase
MADIVISPFSNSSVRDWPAYHFSALVGLLLEKWRDDGVVRVVGTGNQRHMANEIVRPHPSDRVENACGRLSWDELVESLKAAACVIGNNSGIPHLAGYYGRPTVCVCGGSHQRLEWRPLGFSVVVVSRVLGCSPCQLDHGHVSPFAKACLREIKPEVVAEAAISIMDRVRSHVAVAEGNPDASGGATLL